MQGDAPRLMENAFTGEHSQPRSPYLQGVDFTTAADTQLEAQFPGSRCSTRFKRSCSRSGDGAAVMDNGASCTGDAAAAAAAKKHAFRRNKISRLGGDAGGDAIASE